MFVPGGRPRRRSDVRRPDRATTSATTTSGGPARQPAIAAIAAIDGRQIPEHGCASREIRARECPARARSSVAETDVPTLVHGFACSYRPPDSCAGRAKRVRRVARSPVPAPVARVRRVLRLMYRRGYTASRVRADRRTDVPAVQSVRDATPPSAGAGALAEPYRRRWNSCTDAGTRLRASVQTSGHMCGPRKACATPTSPITGARARAVPSALELMYRRGYTASRVRTDRRAHAPATQSVCDVEVVEPPDLWEAVAERVWALAARYGLTGRRMV